MRMPATTLRQAQGEDILLSAFALTLSLSKANGALLSGHTLWQSDSQFEI